MYRLMAIVAVLLTVLGGSAIGFLAGAQSTAQKGGAHERMDLLESARSFYMALNALDPDAGSDDLAQLLSPDFVEKRIELLQTLDRAAFLRAASAERRFSPHLQFVPEQLGSDGAWVMAVVRMTGTESGEIVGIEIAAPTALRREMLNIVDGRIRERIVLEGETAAFWPAPATELPIAGIGPQVIDVVRHTYEPHAQERFELAAPALLIVQSGRLAIESGGRQRVILEPASSRAITELGAIEIDNRSSTPAVLLMVMVASTESPQSDPAGLRALDAAPGVTVQRVAQSGPFVRRGTCVAIEAGFAVLAGGARVPRHETQGYEIVIPSRAAVDAFAEQGTFFRADFARSWQDRTVFATLDIAASAVAPPESVTRYVVSGDEPASLWIVSVRLGDRCRG